MIGTIEALLDEAFASADPEAELKRLRQGCTEWSCMYHGAFSRALHDLRRAA